MNAVTVQELKGQANALFEQAKVILSNSEALAEDKAKIPQMIEDAKSFQAQAAQLVEIEAALKAGAGVAERQGAGQEEPAGPGKFANVGQWLSAVAEAGNVRYRGPLDPRLKALSDPDERGDPWRGEAPAAGVKAGWNGGKGQKATMIENVGARGGFLVPQEFNTLLRGIDPMRTPFGARATTIRMRRRQVQVPVVDQTGTTAGSPHWFGGMTATWTEESEQKNQSDPTFRQMTLTAHKLICYTRASDELLDDEAVGLVDFLNGALGFAGAIEWHREYAFLRGTGAGQPLGVINAGATISVAAQANPPAAASIYTDLVNMLENFLPGASGMWFVNQRHLSDLLLANGPTGNASYLWGNMAAGQPGTLLGYPYVLTEKLPAPGSAGSILLADPIYYLVGERQATTIESTNIERFQYDETSWRAVHRVDGQPWLSAPITLADGTAQVSPFVILGAKST